MVRDLVHDPFFLAQKSGPATPADAQVITDLLDTLRAHHDGCVGMGFMQMAMVNANFKPKKDKFTGFTAQIIQHELDHVNGVLI